MEEVWILFRKHPLKDNAEIQGVYSSETNAKKEQENILRFGSAWLDIKKYTVKE